MAGAALSWIGAVAALVGIALATGCDTSSDGQAERPRIVATTSIWSDVVSNVACDGLAEVTTLIPAGSDPHSFEPSLADRAELEMASLVVTNGLGLEERLDGTIEAVRESGVPVFVVADNIEAPGPGEGEAGQADGGRLADADDPHVWFDPRRVASALPELAADLTQGAGLDPGAVRACLADYTAELEALDAEVEATLNSVPEAQRTLVTNHDSLGYLAERYGYEIVGTVIPAQSSLAQTNPAQLQRLSDTVRSRGVRAIFAEFQGSRDEAIAVGERAGGVEVITLFTGALGDEESGADTYTGFMRTNADLISDGLR